MILFNFEVSRSKFKVTDDLQQSGSRGILLFFRHLAIFYASVRHKVKEILDLIQNDERLRDERKKAKKNKDKYQGMSGESMRFHSGYSKFLGYFVIFCLT